MVGVGDVIDSAVGEKKCQVIQLGDDAPGEPLCLDMKRGRGGSV